MGKIPLDTQHHNPPTHTHKKFKKSDRPMPPSRTFTVIMFSDILRNMHRTTCKNILKRWKKFRQMKILGYILILFIYLSSYYFLTIILVIMNNVLLDCTLMSFEFDIRYFYFRREIYNYESSPGAFIVAVSSSTSC